MVEDKKQLSSVFLCNRKFELHSAIADLTHRLGRAPNASEVAAESGLTREEVVDYLMQYRGSSRERNSAVITRAKEVCLDDLETALVHRSRAEGLSAELRALTDEERAVVLMRIGGALNYTDMGDHIGTSPTWASITLARALTKLREKM